MSTQTFTQATSRFLEALEWVKSEHGLSERQIAAKMGINAAAFSHLRSGHTVQPSNQTIYGLNRFGINHAWVLTGAQDMLFLASGRAHRTGERPVAYDLEDDRETLLWALKQARQRIAEMEGAASLRPGGVSLPADVVEICELLVRWSSEERAKFLEALRVGAEREKATSAHAPSTSAARRKSVGNR